MEKDATVEDWEMDEEDMKILELAPEMLETLQKIKTEVEPNLKTRLIVTDVEKNVFDLVSTFLEKMKS